MKKIFTLLFCITAMALAANANSRAEMCINALLGNHASASLNAIDLDANHDGVINITDVTAFIDMDLQTAQAEANRAPEQEIDVDAIARKVVEAEVAEPTITDVNEAIHKNLKK